MKTYMAKEKDLEKKWYLMDAQDKVLGRLATEAARILRGKHKPEFTPHIDCGDYVVVINAEKVKLTGKKVSQDVYTKYSGYPGGLRTRVTGEMLRRNPEQVIYMAVKGMLPKGILGKRIFGKLRVYKGSEHENQAQKPEVWNF